MIKNININVVLNGYFVTVGCQTVVFNTRADLLRELDNYLADPCAVEKRYRETAVNKDLLNHPIPAAMPAGSPVVGWGTDAATPQMEQAAAGQLIPQRR